MGTRLALITVCLAAAQACGDSANDVSAGDASSDAAAIDGGDTDTGGGGGGRTSPGGPETDAGGAPSGSSGEAICARCDSSASCDPDAATPRCVCDPGFEHEGDQSSACVDLDECDLGEDDCSNDASCTNTDGSYECECDDGFTGDGQDCEDVDECEDDPCDDDASCNNTDGSYECECDDGFEGDGESCDDIDECDDDPCDEYASCENTEGSYECECDEGFTGDGESCACNLTGTFAAVAEVDVVWESFYTIAAGEDTSKSWSIRRMVQTGDTIEVEITPCGGTSSDLCSSSASGPAYGQYVPDAVWDSGAVEPFESTWDLSDPDPDDDFEGPLEVTLLGLRLDDPDGDWPQSNDDDAITEWVDDDGDDGQFDGDPNAALTPTPLGVTTVIRTSGPSTDCPGQSYAAVPLLPFGTNSAAYIMTGERSQARLDGKLVSCDVMGGKLGGPAECHGDDNDDDVPCFDGRLRNCMRTGNVACSDAEINAFDDSLNDPGTTVTASRFVMERVDDDITCAEVRAHTFPTIPD